MEKLSIVALLAGFTAFAVAPAWMPSIKLFLASAVAFYAASAAAYGLLLSNDAEGPEAMSLGVLLAFFDVVFFISCAARLVRIGTVVYARRRTSG